MSEAPALIVIDGVCVLCNATARFVVARDPMGQFRFCHYQSEVGRTALRENGCDPEVMDTVVLIDAEGAHRFSDAALRVARRLRFPWPILWGFRFLPRGIRDGIYRWVARNRYRWFGREEQCIVPDERLRERFIGDD